MIYRDWGRSPAYFFTHLICLFCLVGFPGNALCGDSPEAVNVDSATISAAIHNYKTLCDFKDTPNFPTSFIYSKGSFGAEGGCSDLEKKYDHPPAVIVTFINNEKEEMKVPIPGLDKVTVIKKNGKLIPAIAYRTFTQVGPGVSYYFMTKMSNTLTVVASPQKTLDLIFIFPDAEKGDLIQIGNLIPIVIK